MKERVADALMGFMLADAEMRGHYPPMDPWPEPVPDDAPLLDRLRYRIEYGDLLATGDCDPQIYTVAEEALEALRCAQQAGLDGFGWDTFDWVEEDWQAYKRFRELMGNPHGR